MRQLLIAPVAPLVLLAACGQQPAPAPSPTAAASDSGYVAKVKALPDTQRAGVLLRAIRDADQPCQQVVDQKAVPTPTGATWLATCEDQGHWVVAISDDGTATVANAKDVQRVQGK